MVSKLKGTDPAQLLVDLKPRPFKFAELYLNPQPGGCSHNEILQALERHPVLQKADGHPGTLVRSRFGGDRRSTEGGWARARGGGRGEGVKKNHPAR